MPRILLISGGLLLALLNPAWPRRAAPTGITSLSARSLGSTIQMRWKSWLRFRSIEIWRTEGDDKPSIHIATIPGDASSFTDQSPIPDSENIYRLKGLDKNGEVIAESFAQSVYFVYEPKLVPVEGLKIYSDADEISLKWDYPTKKGISHFKIFLAKGQQRDKTSRTKMKFYDFENTRAFVTKYALRTKLGGWYHFYVIAVSASGVEGPAGAAVTVFKEEKGKPRAPFALRAQYGQISNSVHLAWELPHDLKVKNLALYKAYSKKKERLKNLSSLKEVILSKSAQDKDVRPGVWYTYGIVARNLPGGLLSSTPESAMVYAEPIYVPLPIPPAVEKLSYKKDDDAIRVRWENDKAGDDVRYSVYMKELKEKNYTLMADKIDRRKFEFDAKKYPKGTVLYLYVVPINGDGVRGGKGETIILTIG